VTSQPFFDTGNEQHMLAGRFTFQSGSTVCGANGGQGLALRPSLLLGVARDTVYLAMMSCDESAWPFLAFPRGRDQYDSRTPGPLSSRRASVSMEREDSVYKASRT